MFKNRNTLAFVGTAIALVYAIYIISYISGANSSTTDDAEAAGAAIATLLALPHLLITILGVIFGLLGFFLRKAALTLVAAILYAVAAVFFLIWGWMLIPSIVLGFVAYSQQKKSAKA